MFHFDTAGHSRRAWMLTLCGLCLGSVACGDDAGGGGEPGADAASGEGSPDAGSDGGASSALVLPPPTQGHGEQFTMLTHIEAGQEVEHCKFVRVGDEDLIVNHDEVKYTAGSHHVLLFSTPYEELPTEDLMGAPVDTKEVFDCSEGTQGYWRLNGLISASQNPSGPPSIEFPEHIGVRIPAHAILLINAHYINPTDEDLDPEVFINLHTVPESDLEQEGGLIFWYNPFLKIPAAGQSEMSASCPISEDIKLTNAQSHMHRRGVGYEATLIAPDGERSAIYATDHWEDVPVEGYKPGIEVASGSRIAWTCAYDNPDTHVVYQGARSTDEMCMFIGAYYPRNDAIGFCTTQGRGPFLHARWEIGQGSASCKDSFSCVVSASLDQSSSNSTTGTGAQSRTSAITECLLASDPEVSAPVSEMIGCLASTPSDGDPLASCSNEIAACSKL